MQSFQINDKQWRSHGIMCTRRMNAIERVPALNGTAMPGCVHVCVLAIPADWVWRCARERAGTVRIRSVLILIRAEEQMWEECEHRLTASM